MRRIHIECKWPESYESGGLVFGILPTIGHCEVFAVDEKGNRALVEGVTGVTWSAHGGEDSVAKATIECIVSLSADAAEFEPGECTRDHLCAVDGPCNGWPRKDQRSCRHSFVKANLGDYFFCESCGKRAGT